MEKAPGGIDPTIPSVARIYDFLLGGKDNFAVDREAAARVLELSPNAKEEVQANRRFLSRAVRFMADQGIRQFLDIGTGLPTQENVHQVALRAAPDSRIVYVDNDPIVLVHARALLANNRQTIVVEGDLREPAGVMNNQEIIAHLDLSKPVGLLLIAILHFIPYDAALRIVATLRDHLAPGSYLAISHATPGDLGEEELAELRRLYANSPSGPVLLRPHEEILRFFDEFELVEPGLVRVDDWHPDEGDVTLPRRRGGTIEAGLGLVP